MLEPANSTIGFWGMAMMVFLFVTFFLCRVWCLTDVIREMMHQRRK
ncbi:MAG: hypothetical protein H6Q72_3928 [Firmicutes bacterium]|nr:hypothetical protein [Bacillota bacterium]